MLLWSKYRLTLFGRSLLLLASELLANIVCWIVAGLLFGKHTHRESVLSLALLSWTIGLRHALDADHISAIDNATRGLIGHGQLPVTCGLFFSLGHSTIVIVNVAIAISTDVYNKIGGVGTVGGIVGSAVSGSFLFLIGLANSIILFNILRKRRKISKLRAEGVDPGIDIDEGGHHHNNTLMMRILGPVINFVDRPWKMYPVGVLFGFGFDTASSIALLAVSAIAKRGSDGKPIPPGDIVILPFLFTAGMTLIDSVDSILMLYSYAGFPENSWAIFEHDFIAIDAPAGDLTDRLGDPVDDSLPQSLPPSQTELPAVQEAPRSIKSDFGAPKVADLESVVNSFPQNIDTRPGASSRDARMARDLRVKKNTMSSLSIALTLMSIVVAFSISIITLLGLVGDNCRSCKEAASAEEGHGGGLAGSWWRTWAKANDKSGLIGAGIVGAFVLLVSTWYGVGWLRRKIGGGR
ncbi:NicO-domain-containing protein [Athelia psychrophila]|uniref:Nickel/cobalt efflux system n=1 Tax=Athelia psychrophila TaxID=1759441 RepID=A0A166UNC4_9AGAM|nr:NicO-domain-containing protein [Fibularhizoctonia sp. CBS 109695]